MTKAEYNTWITDTYFIVNSCENLGTIDVVFNHDMTLVMLIDLIKMTTVKQKIKDNNTREAIAIAFTKLMGGEIPKTENIPEYKCENEEKIRKMPEPQNGWIGKTNSGEWFIVVREPDNDEYYTMVYETGGFDRGTLKKSCTCSDFDIDGFSKTNDDSIELFVKSRCFLNAKTFVSRDENIIWRRRFGEMEDSKS